MLTSTPIRLAPSSRSLHAASPLPTPVALPPRRARSRRRPLPAPRRTPPLHRGPLTSTRCRRLPAALLSSDWLRASGCGAARPDGPATAERRGRLPPRFPAVSLPPGAGFSPPLTPPRGRRPLPTDVRRFPTRLVLLATGRFLCLASLELLTLAPISPPLPSPPASLLPRGLHAEPACKSCRSACGPNSPDCRSRSTPRYPSPPAPKIPFPTMMSCKAEGLRPRRTTPHPPPPVAPLQLPTANGLRPLALACRLPIGCYQGGLGANGDR